MHAIYSRTMERAKTFADQWGIPNTYTDMASAIQDPEVDTVVIGLPNHMHHEAIMLAAEAKKAILCTKPLARTAQEAKEILECG